jgi:ring-1,2-phenylacetyl-CoA epoxidase subunit PaaD
MSEVDRHFSGELTTCDVKYMVILPAFGSTACKALWKCEDCLEPFDQFKCL